MNFKIIKIIIKSFRIFIQVLFPHVSLTFSWNAFWDHFSLKLFFSLLLFSLFSHSHISSPLHYPISQFKVAAFLYPTLLPNSILLALPNLFTIISNPFSLSFTSSCIFLTLIFAVSFVYPYLFFSLSFFQWSSSFFI